MRLRLSLLLSLLSALAWGQLVNDTGTVATGSVLRVGTSTVVATANRTSCTAPCAVHFDATGTTYPDGTTADKYLALDYRWNFDDVGSGNWERGARYRGGYTQSRNVEYGFVAAHVFETAGTYDVQLLVTDGNTSSTLAAPITITVTAANTTWATTSTICVSSSGTPVAGSGGCPSGASVANATEIETIMETTCNVDTAAVRCLLKGGDTFTASNEADLGNNAGPAMIGAYGTGKAIIDVVGNTGVFEVGQTTDLRIVDMDIQYDTGTANGSQGGIYVEQTTGHLANKFLSLRNTITSADTGIYFRGDYPLYHPLTNMHDGLAFIDTVVTDGTGEGGNDYFLQGKNIAVMGSEGSNKRVPDLLSPDGEHVIRVKYSRKGIYAHNEFGLLDNTDPYSWGCSPVGTGTPGVWGSQGNTIMKMISGYAADIPTPSEATSGEGIISDNYISKCRHGAFDMGIGPTDDGAEKAAEHHEYWVVEGNHFVSDKNERTPSGSGQHLHLSNIEHVVVRNNVFDVTMPLASNLGGVRAVQLITNTNQTSDPDYIASDDIRVYNNLMYQGADSRSGSTRILFSNQATDASNVVAKNNVVRSSYAQAVVYNPVPNECCGCTTSTAGTCSVDSYGGTSPFSASPASPSILSNFEPAVGSAIENTGSALPGIVQHDAAGRCRADGSWDIGPMERAAAECAGP